MPATSKGSRRAVPQPPPPSIEPHSPLWGVGRVGAWRALPAAARCPGPVRALHRYRPLYGGAVAPPPCGGGHLRSSHRRPVGCDWCPPPRGGTCARFVFSATVTYMLRYSHIRCVAVPTVTRCLSRLSRFSRFSRFSRSSRFSRFAFASLIMSPPSARWVSKRKSEWDPRFEVGDVTCMTWHA